LTKKRWLGHAGLKNQVSIVNSWLGSWGWTLKIIQILKDEIKNNKKKDKNIKKGKNEDQIKINKMMRDEIEKWKSIKKII